MILNNGNSTADRGLDLFDLTGSGGITSSTISGSSETNVRIENNTSSTLSAFNVTGSTISNTSVVTGDDGILVLNDGAGGRSASLAARSLTTRATISRPPLTLTRQGRSTHFQQQHVDHDSR